MIAALSGLVDPQILYGLIIAVLVGLSKTGIPGVGIAAVPFMAVLIGDGKYSVGVLLPLLIFADIFAVIFYRRHADWKIIGRLSPWIIVGACFGVWGLMTIDAIHFKPVLGGLVLLMLGLEIVRRIRNWHALPNHPLLSAGSGLLVGFSTYLGNAAGPIANIYLLCMGFPKHRFIGSIAWLFLLVNLSKLPVYVPLGMITADSLLLDLKLCPGILLGVFLGRAIFPHIRQDIFNGLILVLSALSALYLIFQ